MPETVRKIIAFTPFEGIYFTPVQIYLGTISGGEILAGFIKQLVWICLLMVCGFVLWNKGKRKLVVQGG